MSRRATVLQKPVHKRFDDEWELIIPLTIEDLRNGPCPEQIAALKEAFDVQLVCQTFYDLGKQIAVEREKERALEVSV
jgi:hypothetical protein